MAAALLNFPVDLNGTTINGVDLIKWNEDGKSPTSKSWCAL